MFAHHFSINNLPYGIASSEKFRGRVIATRLGDDVYSIPALLEHKLLGEVPPSTASAILRVCLILLYCRGDLIPCCCPAAQLSGLSL